jgi:hypothetical protein
LLSWRRSVLSLASICACEVPSAPSLQLLEQLTPPLPSGGGGVVSGLRNMPAPRKRISFGYTWLRILAEAVLVGFAMKSPH